MMVLARLRHLTVAWITPQVVEAGNEPPELNIEADPVRRVVLLHNGLHNQLAHFDAALPAAQGDVI